MKNYKDIFEAILKNDIEAVKTFLPDQLEDRDGDWFSNSTPLYKACMSGRIEIASLLLDSGADIEARDKNGQTPLYITCVFGYYYISELLVMRGADPYVTDNYGTTALDCDRRIVKDKDENEVPHREILKQLRAEYLNKQTLEASERTAALSSGWEMEM